MPKVTMSFECSASNSDYLAACYVMLEHSADLDGEMGYEKCCEVLEYLLDSLWIDGYHRDSLSPFMQTVLAEYDKVAAERIA